MDRFSFFGRNSNGKNPDRRQSVLSQATEDADDVFYDAEESYAPSPARDLALRGTSDVLRSSEDATQLQPNLESTAPKWPSSINCFELDAAPLRQKSGPPDVATTSQGCEVCEIRIGGVWFCNVCTMNFCEQCWDAQVVHKKHRRGIPHEKTNPDVAAKVHNVLSPPQDEDVREELYKVDAPTAWFGVERPDDSSAPLFQDYGRFAELMATTDPVLKDPAFVERWTEIGRDKRTPSLVSFVGQTGAGKSTLIKLLIDFAAVGNGTYSSPVVGPRGAHIPTSEDVHLYVDPKTADSAGPLLYSDCEGLEGGEREPLAAKFKRKRRQGHTESDLPKTKVISERELQWANEPRARSREFAVTNLYPRLLYTFSDVIVFVLRNPRVIEHVFERLVKWAAAAIETSSNQPVLPHAIIALNASENDSDVTQWDVPHSTESILFDLQNTVNRNETFKKWAQFWRERGRTIETLLHLILCYYSSIQIIRLPAEGRPKLMEDQINQLYASILSGSIAARHARYQARMLLDVEDLNNYLQEAFNHYSNTLESPFDFVQASFRNSPIPPDFGGNILKLALEMMAILKAEKRLDARRIFAELSYMVASCIMLDSARNNNKGSSSQIFPKYIHHLDDALENFCDQHWPCEFVNHKTGARCVNVRSGHSSKGHQSADGKVFATGDWISNFSFADHGPTFRVKVYHCLTELLKELTTRMQDNSESEEQLASEIHKSIILTNLLSHAKFSDANSRGHRCLISHTACFCCLFGQAEHCLPCGHVLCNACLHTYGFPKGANGLEIRDCPFESIPEGGLFPRLIRLKPKSAGTRVITLDGGGIRGIIELETLRQIELALGGVPIQFFVDLIVGTSTGGIIALGLASMGWTVDKCIEYFESLCHEAFTRRIGSSLPVIGSFVDNYHHSKYQTSTLENALQEAFTDNISLFGGPQPALSNVKVAVTATSLAGNKTYILSNYNHHHRNIERPNYYHFQRPELPSAELKVWEAARATSAAPRFFKSFHHELSQKTYIDGAMFHNNPVRVADSERKILWPDSQIPDIFLSIGTGSTQSLERSGTEKMEAARKGIFSHGRYLYNIMRSNIQQTLDCERAWDDYISSVANSFTSPSPRSRFLRINPNVGEIPALDEKDKIASLRRKAEVELKLDLRIKDLARQLIASTFYFDIISVSEVDEENGTIDIRGQIRCRLLQPSAEMDEFSQHLKARTSGNEEMKFVIFQDGDTKPLVTVYLTPTVADTMIRNRVCHLRSVRFPIKSKLLPTHIHLHFGPVSVHSISGFPRLITQHNTSLIPGIPKPHIVSNISRRYTHGSRREQNSAENWKPPDPREAGTFSNLHQFASQPSRILGHDAMLLKVAGPAAKTPLIPSPPTSRKMGHVRDAFRALLGPLRSRTEGYGSSSTVEQGFTPSIEAWLKQVAPPAETSAFMASLGEYNVAPWEYTVYEHWMRLLQPSNPEEKSYWGPPEANPDAFMHRPLDREYFSPDHIGRVELGDTSVMAELADTSAKAPADTRPIYPATEDQTTNHMDPMNFDESFYGPYPTKN